MNSYKILRHSKGPWKDHKYLKVENGKYVYDIPKTATKVTSVKVKNLGGSSGTTKSNQNKNEEYDRSFTNTAVYKTGKMDGPLKGVPYSQAAGGWYMYNNPDIKNGKGKYLVFDPNGKRIYINDASEFRDLRKGKTDAASSGSSSSNKRSSKKKTPAEQIEELKDEITEIGDLKVDLEGISSFDALANRELERLEAIEQAKREALQKKKDAKRIAEAKKKEAEKLKRKRAFEKQNRVRDINAMSHRDTNGYGVIIHSKGPWKNHKYLKIVGGQYIYSDSDLKGEVDKVYNKSKSNGYDKAKEIASKVGGGKVGDQEFRIIGKKLEEDNNVVLYKNDDADKNKYPYVILDKNQGKIFHTIDKELYKELVSNSRFYKKEVPNKPKSDPEINKEREAKEKADREKYESSLKGKAEKKIGEVKKSVSDAADKGKDTLSNIVTKGKKGLSDAKNKLSNIKLIGRKTEMNDLSDKYAGKSEKEVRALLDLEEAKKKNKKKKSFAHSDSYRIIRS